MANREVLTFRKTNVNSEYTRKRQKKKKLKGENNDRVPEQDAKPLLDRGWATNNRTPPCGK